MTEHVEIAVEQRHATDMALKVFDGAREVWIPRSQIRDSETDHLGNVISIAVPHWLARKEGLI